MKYYYLRDFKILIYIPLLLIALSCGEEKSIKKKSIKVTATAFNSVRYQTSSQPKITAWGDTLKPGLKAIAVSRDLIDSGLTHGTKVNIEGFKGDFVVLDKMDGRFKNTIDIYFGQDIDSAKEWGTKEIKVSWLPDSSITTNK